jgi:hypothetical protein
MPYGDNEWTDCDRASNGSYDPNERLALVRRMFASTPQSLGQRKLALQRQAIDFPGQVVLVNGDSHFLKIDKPLTDAAGTVIQNLTRVQTPGSDQNHWVSATIDAADPNVFTFHPHVIAANVPAYVKP